MSGSVVNHLLLARYEKLLNKLYIEPKSEEIVATFVSVANKKRETSRSKTAAVKKATAEERGEIKRHSGYVAKSKIKKG